MTDVRLTATNPADSSVVPVACNEKGELLLEEPSISSDEFVAKDGDTMTGNLHLGDKIILNPDGSAQFAGGAFDIYENGSATFAGNTTVKNAIILGDNGAAGLTGGIYDRGLSANAYSAFTSTDQTNPTILLKRDGSAEFAGEVASNMGIYSNRYGNTRCGIALRANIGTQVNDFGFVITDTSDKTLKFGVSLGGSATFAGDVVVGSRNKQWMLVESGGICHLVEQTRSIDTADLVTPSEAITYPELRNLPQELDQLTAVVTALLTEVQRVEERLRMAPEGGWPVWDGSD